MSTFSTTSTLADTSESAVPASRVSEVPPTIPPVHTNRTLVLCFDGTGDQFNNDNSNIVLFVSTLKKGDRSKQMVYYQAGIGTYTTPEIATPLMSKFAMTLDMMVAWSLDIHVISGYEFLMETYEHGDRICIFGFSRGAYTARALAGMLHKVGLLPACNFQQIPFAYKMFARADDIGWKQSNAFKRAFSVDVPIEFIGVWDTVNSVGLIPHTLPFTTSNTIVRTFRHALSLDERRAKFKANLWNRPNAVEETLGFHSSHRVVSNVIIPPSEVISKSTAAGASGSKHTLQNHSSLEQLEDQYGIQQAEATDVLEVWFAGSHGDVGGGCVSNSTPHSLARISLRWMIRECFKTGTGIMFDSDCLREIGIDPASLYPIVLPRPPPLPIGDARIRPPTTASTTYAPNPTIPFKAETEEQHELHDVLSPLFDQLKLTWQWWILEVFPIQHRYQRGDNKWATDFYVNLGRPRFIPKQRVNGFKVHRSVKMRMEAQQEKGDKYKPWPGFLVEPTWVD